MRLGARSTQRLTNRLRLALEPECLENPTATAREIPRDGADSVRNTQAVCGFRCWASKLAPLFPHDQHDGGNLPGQGQTRHLRSEALGQQSCVELLKRPRFARGHDRRTLKQILQIEVTVSVQSAKGDLFLGSFELPVDPT